MKRTGMFFVLFAGMTGILVAGCATSAGGSSDEELITQRIQEGIAAIKAKDFDAFTDMISPSFYSSAIGDRDDLMAYLRNADGMGFLDGVEIDLSDAQTVVDGDAGTLEPVTVSGVFGSITLSFEGVKEKGVWVISGLTPGF